MTLRVRRYFIQTLLRHNHLVIKNSEVKVRSAIVDLECLIIILRTI